MPLYKDENIKIKRYGQVFSGRLVGDLLVSMLPNNIDVRTVIDPMVGQGDLLQSAYSKYSNAEIVLGIDIDEDVNEKCNEAIPKARIYIEDAFKSEHLNISGGWDLVITNPPYIRYQTLKNNPEIGLPDGNEIRESLINHIRHSENLDIREKQLYLDITRKYSGLSDMAVPSWILCASIVKLGGYMAMVVPETWLNRDYALPIHYLLLRCFDIIAISRDVETVWFDNAEVRTCLVICRRKENESIEHSYSNTVLIEISSEIINQDSLVGKLEHDEKSGYDALNWIISQRVLCSLNGFSSRIVPAQDLFPGLTGWINRQKWIDKEDEQIIDESTYLPNEIKAIVNKANSVNYDSLVSLGWSVGQGLRTGANDFFYAKLLSEETVPVVKMESWYDRQITISKDNIRKAFKKRGDITGLVVNYEDLERCLLYIQHQVRQSDYHVLSQRKTTDYTVMDPELDDYITQGEKYISPTNKKSFKELSAVITNEKKTKYGVERFWYMLPPLKERHVPNLCISRVCGDSPEAIYVNQVSGKEVIVDANFITLWNQDCHEQIIAFALLNSTWSKLSLELSGTVMGGGALKIEASHVRRIVFPRLDEDKIKELHSIGKRILKKGKISSIDQNKIDEIVISPFGEENINTICNQLEELLNRKKQERTGRGNDK